MEIARDVMLHTLMPAAILSIFCLAMPCVGASEFESRAAELVGRQDGTNNLATVCASITNSLKIIDEAVTGIGRASSVEHINDPYFRSFVYALRDYIPLRLREIIRCPEIANDWPMIDLIFVRLPLVMSGNELASTIPTVESTSMDSSCRLQSPWLQLSISRLPSLRLSAVFIWNERQLLLDQALLSGASASVQAPLTPLANDLFKTYAEDYANTEILQSPSAPDAQSDGAISKRIPADVLWLFRRSAQSTLAPFSRFARIGMKRTLDRAAASYTKLVLALFDQCLEADSTAQSYMSVLDVGELVPLQEYKIRKLY